MTAPHPAPVLSREILTTNMEQWNPLRRPAWLPVEFLDPLFLGMGGQAEAWRVRCARTGRVLCVKRYRQRQGQGFYRELSVMLSVSSPHLVSLINVLDLPQSQMLLMEYCSGGSLRNRLESTGPISVREAVELGRQALAGLAVLHAQRLVHADLKPENVFLARRTGAPLFKLADFGVSRLTTQFHHLPKAFTQAYAAPEQMAGFAIPASDLYSLALVVGEAMGADPRKASYPPSVPDSLVRLLNQALSTDPGHRPSSESWSSVFEAVRTELISHAYSAEGDSSVDG